MNVNLAYCLDPAKDDIQAVNQLNKLRSSLSENELTVFYKLGERYVSQIMSGIYRSGDYDDFCSAGLNKIASDINIDLGMILKNLPQAAWLFITRHRPDLLDSLASSHETRQAIIADVISRFFGCTGQ